MDGVTLLAAVGVGLWLSIESGAWFFILAVIVGLFLCMAVMPRGS